MCIIKNLKVVCVNDDPTANVDWGSLLNGIEPVLSEKDQTGQL
mgnify:CR=1 FL=1